MRIGLFILKIALISTADNIHMASTNKIAVLGGGSIGSTLAKALADANEDVTIPQGSQRIWHGGTCRE